MKLSEKFKERMCYAYILLVLSFMLLSCNVKLSKRNKTQDELQMQFFREQLKTRQYYITKI
jgi:outer membrane biogenesis lipoprotein LolB